MSNPSQPHPVEATPMSTGQRASAAGYAVLLVPASLLLATVSIFALSPTDCPETGGSYLCRYGGATTASLLVLAVGALGAIVLAILGVAARTARRGCVFSVLSVSLFVGLVLAMSVAASTW